LIVEYCRPSRALHPSSCTSSLDIRPSFSCSASQSFAFSKAALITPLRRPQHTLFSNSSQPPVTTNLVRSLSSGQCRAIGESSSSSSSSSSSPADFEGGGSFKVDRSKFGIDGRMKSSNSYREEGTNERDVGEVEGERMCGDSSKIVRRWVRCRACPGLSPAMNERQKGLVYLRRAGLGENEPSSQDSRSAASLDDSPCSTPPFGNTHFLVPSSRSFRELVKRKPKGEGEEPGGGGTSSRATATARGEAIRVWIWWTERLPRVRRAKEEEVNRFFISHLFCLTTQLPVRDLSALYECHNLHSRATFQVSTPRLNPNPRVSLLCCHCFPLNSPRIGQVSFCLTF